MIKTFDAVEESNKIINDLFNEVAEFCGCDLTMFDNTQTTLSPGLSDEMKTYYSDYLIDNALPLLVHDQFGQKHPIPKNKGKTIEFRKYDPLQKALTPLQEGVTPSGNSLRVSTIPATVSQYGDYIELSDVLLLTAIDNNLVHATELLGNQAGETLDTIVREVINSGTNAQYADAQVSARFLLVGGSSTPENNHYLTVDCIRRGVRNLKVNKAKRYDSYFVAIIHPDVAYDIMGDKEWVEASKYAGSTQLFEGEIGKIHGVRFVETTEAKIFHAEDLVAYGSTNARRTLTVNSYSSKVITIKEALTSSEALDLAGRKIIVDGVLYTIASAEAGAAGAATVTIVENPPSGNNPASNDVIYPGEAGAAGRDVYSTLVIGKNAYGVTEVTGGGLETIVKQLGSGGTSDPLNQRATVGWKAIKTAEILTQTFMVRIETASTFQSGPN